jgi:hypothetical protein
MISRTRLALDEADEDLGSRPQLDLKNARVPAQVALARSWVPPPTCAVVTAGVALGINLHGGPPGRGLERAPGSGGVPRRNRQVWHLVATSWLIEMFHRRRGECSVFPPLPALGPATCRTRRAPKGTVRGAPIAPVYLLGGG